MSVAMLLSSLIVLRFVRSTTTDTYLLLFVTLANANVARAVLTPTDPSDFGHRKKTSPIYSAGVFTGLAFLTKGPVAILQIVLPWVVWGCVAKFARARHSRRDQVDKEEIRLRDDGMVSSSSARSRVDTSAFSDDPRGASPAATVKNPMTVVYLVWILFALLVAVLIGASWFVAIYLRHPEVINVWTREVTRVGATNEATGSPLLYLTIIGFVFVELELSSQNRFGNEFRLRESDDFVGHGGFIFEVFEVDDLGVEIHAQLFHDFATGQDVLDLGLFDASVDDGLRDGVV
jgi:hypothetical protein